MTMCNFTPATIGQQERYSTREAAIQSAAWSASIYRQTVWVVAINDHFELRACEGNPDLRVVAVVTKHGNVVEAKQ